MTLYRIVRMFKDGHPAERGDEMMTLAEAQAHCRDPETSSRTAIGPAEIALTVSKGDWFDGYEEA